MLRRLRLQLVVFGRHPIEQRPAVRQQLAQQQRSILWLVVLVRLAVQQQFVVDELVKLVEFVIVE